MTTEESLALYGLTPKEADLPQIRAILDREAEIERNHYNSAVGRKGDPRQREDDLAMLSCVQLFAYGDLQDVLRIWDAKQTSMDMACYLDVQFLCGAGLEETKAYLSTLDSENAKEALEYILKCEGGGDFNGFSPQSQLAGYRRYFEGG
ncbi:MAG: hypothetical protein ABIY70_15115 [Capsulimonas sp.]|uniref:hypothetical protein n=1 Tax=Capsulimonas sp. TaxID=2494211 RepID=UPI003265B775